MKKILFIANYFYPDVASLGQLVTDICMEIKGQYSIEVVAAIPNYSDNISLDRKDRKKSFYIENIYGVKVHRVIVPNVNKRSKISRIKYILKYYFNSKAAIRDIKEYDIVFTVSQPPILGGLLGKYAKKIKKCKLIYNIQDFNPEQIEAVGYSRSKILISFFKYIDTNTCKVSDVILLVGNDQLETIKKREKSLVSKVHIINNWIDDKTIYPMNKNESKVAKFINMYKLNNKFIVMYSGNLGLFYDLENLIKVAKNLEKYKDILLTFVGDGAKKVELEKYKNNNNLNNIVFIPYQSKEELINSLNAADVHLVVNAKGIKGVSVPSKIYGVMAVGKYIVGVLEKGSEARNIIENCDCGKCVEPQDYYGFERLIIDAYKKREDLTEIGLRSRQYLEEKLTKEKAINKYKNLFDSL